MFYVINELKFNSEHKNRKIIYRVTSNQELVNSSSALTTLDLGPLILESFPEVKKMSRYTSLRSWVVADNVEFLVRPVFVDPDFVEMFSMNILQGDSKNLFSDPNSILISKTMSGKIFGNENPIGREINIRFDQGEHLFRVKAVVDNFSEFSSVRADLFIGFNFYHENLCNPFLESYPFFTTFLMTSQNVDSKLLEAKINVANVKKWTGISSLTYNLQELNKMYLHSEQLGNNLFSSGNPRILYGLIFLVSLVIIMACLNFGILTTASTITRNKEVGIRKINGASVIQVNQQMIFESYLQVLIAVPCALFVAYLLLPWFNNYLNRSLEFNIGNTPFIIGITVLVILTATVSGLFASILSTRVNPVQLLRKEQPKLGLGLSLNKILLTSQMVILIWFIVVTIVIFKQISYSKSSNLGYNPENLMVIHVTDPGWKPDLTNPQYENILKLYDLRQKLLSHPSIKDVSVVQQSPPLRDQISSGIIINPKTNESFTIAILGCLSNFPQLMGYRLKKGEFFSENNTGEQNINEILLNETAVEFMGLDNPIGEVVMMDGARKAKIVGVLYDFNFQSTRQKIVPLRISRTNKFMAQFDIVIRYEQHSVSDVTTYFKKVFADNYYNYESTIDFQEGMIDELYKKEKLEAKILGLGIILAVFIAVMGIMGITLFSVKQQVKEIGIRKINGAGISDILMMLNISVLKWVAAAFVIACPIAWFVMHKWLENFAYKTDLNWWVFVLSGSIAMLISLLAVNWQSWQVATRNPVESLRYE